MLFLSNLLALVLAGVLVFTMLGYSTDSRESAGRAARRTYVTLAILVSLVFIPLVANTVGAYLLTVWTARVQTSAEAWLSGVPEASVTDVSVQSQTFVVEVQTPETSRPSRSSWTPWTAKCRTGSSWWFRPAWGRRSTPASSAADARAGSWLDPMVVMRG